MQHYVLKRYLPCFCFCSVMVLKDIFVIGWFMLVPYVLLKHGCCLYPASAIAKARPAVFTERGVVPKLITRDLRYILCANIKIFNQFHLKLPMCCNF